MKTKFIFLSLILSLNCLAQRIQTTEGPININYLEYYGISARVVQTAVFPLFQDQVRFDGEMTIFEPKMKDTARFDLNYNPFYEYGLDVMIAPQDSSIYEVFKKGKIKRFISKNLDEFKRNEGRIFINSEEFELVAESETNDNVILRYRFKYSNLPIQYWGLRKYDLYTYIEDGVLDRIVIKSKTKEPKKGKKSSKKEKDYFVKTAHFQKLEDVRGYVLKDYHEKTVRFKKGKEQVSVFRTELFNFRDKNGKNVLPERVNDKIDSLSKDDDLTTRIRLERGLPVLGRAAMKAGFDIPLPFGVEAFIHWQREIMKLERVNLNDQDLTSLLNTNQSDVKVDITLTAAKFDTWIFPFLNLSVMAGNSLVNADVTLTLSQEMKDLIGIIDPDTTISALNVSGNINAFFLGGGATLAWGYKGFFMTFNTMFIYSHAPVANTTTKALVLTPLVGYKNRIINVMAGLQYQLYDQNIRGSIDIEGQSLKYDLGFKAQRTNFIVGLQKDFSRHWNASLLVGFKPREQVVLNVGYRF